MTSPAAHRQTRYVAAPGFSEPTPLPLPEPTADIDRARSDLTEYGVCILTGVLDETEVEVLRDKLERQATADFAASCNLFWLLDDFTPARGSTWLVPGSHRWPAEHLIKPPPRQQAVQITAPAGSVYCWDGRVWHSAGANPEGHPRRHVTTFFCLPWTRQQENWDVTCLQEVLDQASPRLRARLGLRTYGTLGLMSGTRTSVAAVSLGNYEVVVPDYIIGENGTLHPMRRVSRASGGEPD